MGIELKYKSGEKVMYANKLCLIRQTKNEKKYIVNHLCPPTTGRKSIAEWAELFPKNINKDHDYIISLPREDGDYYGIVGVYEWQLEPDE